MKIKDDGYAILDDKNKIVAYGSTARWKWPSLEWAKADFQYFKEKYKNKNYRLVKLSLIAETIDSTVPNIAVYADCDFNSVECKKCGSHCTRTEGDCPAGRWWTVCASCGDKI